MSTPIQQVHSKKTKSTSTSVDPQWSGIWRTKDPQQWATLNARPLLVLDCQITRLTRGHYLYLPGEEHSLVESNLCRLLAVVRQAGYVTVAIVHERLSKKGVPDDLICLPPFR